MQDISKVDEKILESCEMENCTENELAVLPSSADVGFEEYFRYKTKLVREKRRIFSPEEQNGLLLSFPAPSEMNAQVFGYFYDSPYVVAQNDIFRGCFGIDITDYAECLDHPRLHELMKYICMHPEAVYVLILQSDDKEQAVRTESFAAKYLEMRTLFFELPSSGRLADYTETGLRSLSLHLEQGVSDVLREEFTGEKYGYDTADHLIRLAKNRGYGGTVEETKKILRDIKETKNKQRRIAGFGY
jgi:hypothetical protein